VNFIYMPPKDLINKIGCLIVRKFFAINLVLLAINVCFARKTEEAKQLDGVFKMLYEQNQLNDSVSAFLQTSNIFIRQEFWRGAADFV
jgi:hypothetical protein